jgi:hypothetical protein
MKEMSNNEDLFKLFAWRECENKEITSITTPASSSSFKQFNKISIKPIKTMNHLNRDNLRVVVLLFHYILFMKNMFSLKLK